MQRPPLDAAIGMGPRPFSAACSHDRCQAFCFKKIAPAGRGCVMWTREVGGGTETTVEQALIRGLDTVIVFSSWGLGKPSILL